MGGSKGQSVQLTIEVISILEGVDNNENTKLFIPRFNRYLFRDLINLYTPCLLKHAYSLAAFQHIGKFARHNAIMIKI